jgi:hypothetical protein
MATWLDDTVKAFEALGGTAKIQDVYSYIAKNTRRKLPATWRASVRKNIEHYSSDSKVYLKKLDLFKSVNGIGKGLWQLRNQLETPKAVDIEEPAKRVKTEVYRVLRDTYMSKNLKVVRL